ncbi:zinc finger BED domain-containing protein 1-like, partial [Tachysurus ichikawai]
ISQLIYTLRSKELIDLSALLREQTARHEVFWYIANSAKKRISHEGSQLRFFHDASAEVLRKRREFDDVRRTLSARDMFRGFAYPAKLRCLHGTQMHLFSSPADVTEFLKALEDK